MEVLDSSRKSSMCSGGWKASRQAHAGPPALQVQAKEEEEGWKDAGHDLVSNVIVDHQVRVLGSRNLFTLLHVTKIRPIFKIRRRTTASSGDSWDSGTFAERTRANVRGFGWKRGRLCFRILRVLEHAAHAGNLASRCVRRSPPSSPPSAIPSDDVTRRLSPRGQNKFPASPSGRGQPQSPTKSGGLWPRKKVLSR